MQLLPIISLLAIALINTPLTAQTHTFTKEQVIADLSYLKSALERSHPNLYIYSSKEKVDNWFAEQTATLPKSLTNATVFQIISAISEIIKDGHTYIYPSAQHLDDFFTTAPLFPLDVFLKADSLLVIHDYSDEQAIPPGARLTRINGFEVDELLSTIITHTCRDGNNLAYPKYLTYQFFPAYFSYFYGFQDKFNIEYEDSNGKIQVVKIKGLPRTQIKPKRSSVLKKGLELDLFLENSAALLTIKSFDRKILKEDYQQNFKEVIKRIFKTLEEHNIKFLAIDLRDNEGGALSNGVYLLQHILRKDFKCVERFYVLKDGNRKKLENKWDDFFSPTKKYHFNGDVFLLLNGGSYSCAAIVANTFKENHRGLVLGQMSGGSAYINSGAPNEMITLPNTKIYFTIPKTQYVLREDLSTIGLGVLPDILIQDDPSRFINDEDKYLDKFLELIETDLE